MGRGGRRRAHGASCYRDRPLPHPPTYADRYTHARVHERARTHRGKHTDMFIHLQMYICTALALGQSPQGRRGREGGDGRGRCGRGLCWQRSGRPSQHLTNAQTDVTEATVSVHVYQSVYLSAQTPDMLKRAFCEYVPAYVQARAGLEASVLMYRLEQALKLLCLCTG